MGRSAEICVHASAVALPPAGQIQGAAALGRGVLFLGPSGAGKSTLSLLLMAFGARLVADDQVMLSALGGCLVASPPAALRGQIEARGVGILSAEPLEQAQIVLVVDLGQFDAARLPQPRTIQFCGIEVPLVAGAGSDHLEGAVLQWLKGGRVA